MNWTTMLALTLCLGACIGAPGWTKEGVAPQAVAGDLADCRSEAKEATRRDADIDADIMASRGHDWQNSGTMSTHQAMFSSTSTQQADDVVKSCMIAKGYVPGE